MDFLSNEINDYAARHTSVESKLLRKIYRETNLEVMRPRMLSGHLQGRVLSMFSSMIQPLLILEIGTFTGYSAICLAEGLAPEGKVITLDINEELENRVRGYFKESKFNNQIDYRIGNAVDIIPSINQSIDLIFIDADKKNYITYYNLVFDKLNKGGYIIADNVLWSGKVVSDSNDPDTVAVKEFNNMVNNDDRVENLLMPIRDGLMVIRKK